MNFYVWWLISVVASFILGLQDELRMTKDAADAGYKINYLKYSKISNDLNSNSSKINILKLFIPGLNIFSVFKRAYQYNQIRPMVLDELNVLGCLEEMTLEEKKEYQKKPTGLNALLVPLKVLIKEQNKPQFISMIVDYNENHDKIQFIIKDGEFEIINVTGPAANLTIEEQRKIVLERISILCEKIDLKDYEMTTENGYIIITCHEKKEKETTDNTTIDDIANTDIKEQQKQLKTQKDNLLSYREQIVSLKENQDIHEQEQNYSKKHELKR